MAKIVPKWQKVSGILANIHVVAWLTATEWGDLAKEIGEEYYSSVTPSNQNFTQCRIGKNLLLRNSGTEDQEVVNEMNRLELGEENLRILEFRKLNWASGYADKLPEERTDG